MRHFYDLEERLFGAQGRRGCQRVAVVLDSELLEIVMVSYDDPTGTHVTLKSDTMISHYRIIEKIDAGGMGALMATSP